MTKDKVRLKFWGLINLNKTHDETKLELANLILEEKQKMFLRLFKKTL